MKLEFRLTQNDWGNWERLSLPDKRYRPTSLTRAIGGIGQALVRLKPKGTISIIIEW